jgi:hypothetical protein
MKVTFFKNIIILFLFVFSSLIIAQQKQKTEANADLIEYTNKEGLPTTNISQILFKLKTVSFGFRELKERTDLMDMNLKKLELILDCLLCKGCITIQQKM